MEVHPWTTQKKAGYGNIQTGMQWDVGAYWWLIDESSVSSNSTITLDLHQNVHFQEIYWKQYFKNLSKFTTWLSQPSQSFNIVCHFYKLIAFVKFVSILVVATLSSVCLEVFLWKLVESPIQCFLCLCCEVFLWKSPIQCLGAAGGLESRGSSSVPVEGGGDKHHHSSTALEH